MPDFEFHPAADEEVEEAYRWYLRRSPAAAFRFLDLVETAVHEATACPNRWQQYLHGTRCFRIPKYPYGLIYLVEPDYIFGVAVAHLHRKPGYWKDRVDRKC